jgi:hypothetical protein
MKKKESRGQCHKTFYVRNLQNFVISSSVRPWQALKPNLTNTLAYYEITKKFI